MYADWVREVEEEAGLSVGYRRIGVLQCAFSDAEREGLARRFLWQRRAGFSVVDRTAAEMAAWLDGQLAREVVGGVFFPEDAVVDSRLLARGVALSAERRGVRMLPGTAARRFLISGGACYGVETAKGPLTAGAVVDAAGAWAAFDASLPLPVPVEPVKGQIAVLRTKGRALPCAVESRDVYLVPRPDGLVLAGATVERVGFQKEVTASALNGLTGAAIRLVPELGQAALRRGLGGAAARNAGRPAAPGRNGGGTGPILCRGALP